MAHLKVQATSQGYKTTLMDAPALEGSEKQVSWAEDIRAEKAAELDKKVQMVAKEKGCEYMIGVSVSTSEPAADLDHYQQYADEITDLINSQIGETAAKVFANTGAKYWIGNRNSSLAEMLQQANQ